MNASGKKWWVSWVPTQNDFTTHPLWEDAPSSHMSDRCRWRHRSPDSWSIWTVHQRLGLCHCVHSSLLRQSALSLRFLRNENELNWARCTMCWTHACPTCLLIKVFIIDDDTLSHSLVAHLILECWWNNSVMAFRRVVLLPRLAILILLTNRGRQKRNIKSRTLHGNIVQN